MRKLRILSVLFLVIAIGACASINALVTKQELTPQARYYDALVTFNRNVEQYNAIYKLSDSATQAKWKAQIDPIIRSVSASLDAWKAVLNTSQADAKEAIWREGSKQLITLLVVSGIIKVQ